MSDGNSITLGIFDGVHMGHRRLIEKTVELKKPQKKAVALTFAYPASYHLDNRNFPGLIYSPQKRETIMKSLGIDEVVFLDFEKLKNLAPLEFIKLIKDEFDPATLTVGFNYHFGKDRLGNSDLLCDMGHRFDFRTSVIPPVYYSGHRVSSSLIRYYIGDGEIKRANDILAKPFSLEGKVYKDQGIGMKLGFPTANFKREGKSMLTPGLGVYLAFSPSIGYGLLNIGKRPTVNEGDLIHYEIHYLNGKHQLYGQMIECLLIEYLRTEKKFENLEQLKDQIERDKQNALKLIAQNNKSDGWWENEI